VTARRAACVESCGSGFAKAEAEMPVTHVEFPSADRDAACVDACNAKKGSRRYKSACVQRCPVASETSKIDSTTDSSSTVEFNPVSYLPLSDLGSSNMNVDKLSNDTSPVETEPILSDIDAQPDAMVIVTEDSTTDEVAVNELPSRPTNNSLDVTNSKSESFPEHITTNAHNASEVQVIHSEPESSKNSDTMLSSSISTDADTTAQAISDSNTTDALNASKVLPMELNSTESVTFVLSSASSFNSSGVINKTTSVNVNNETDHPNIIETTNVTAKANDEIGVDGSKMTYLNVPSVTPGSSTQDSSMNQNDTQLVDRTSPQAEKDQECIEMCTKKRTLKRKRETCLVRCRSAGTSNTASLLTRIDGAKFEL
jgi:hypothetical protein